ncbi:hypothetical protein Patl1_29446 [Pistacia atlantica]|uniref:Uncharacterized protein n=1 Tax=Pistacia atlantica TaxID=434234 RepID=A0ACC1ACQ5_9ROSI|nr:hypothetical protein Patl1_29446 [Pistacia atlantica]
MKSSRTHSRFVFLLFLLSRTLWGHVFPNTQLDFDVLILMQ